MVGVLVSNRAAMAVTGNRCRRRRTVARSLSGKVSRTRARRGVAHVRGEDREHQGACGGDVVDAAGHHFGDPQSDAPRVHQSLAARPTPRRRARARRCRHRGEHGGSQSVALGESRWCIARRVHSQSAMPYRDASTLSSSRHNTAPLRGLAALAEVSQAEAIKRFRIVPSRPVADDDLTPTAPKAATSYRLRVGFRPAAPAVRGPIAGIGWASWPCSRGTAAPSVGIVERVVWRR